MSSETSNEIQLREINYQIEQTRQRRNTGIGLIAAAVLPAILGLGNLYVSITEPGRAGPVSATVGLISASGALTGVGGYLLSKALPMLRQQNSERDALLHKTNATSEEAGYAPSDHAAAGSGGRDIVAEIVRLVIEDLDAAMSAPPKKRAIVLGIVDDRNQVTRATIAIADEICAAIVNDSRTLLLLERDALDDAVRETEYESFLLAEEPEKYGRLAEFAPADVIIVGRIVSDQRGLQLFVRAFSSTDGVVIAAGMYNIPEPE
ncbi:MAG: hypothetical protein KOO61_07930 [Spirochaetales bacterium]|nr:hypothetical protein [Spirochaetales bacterium]